VRLRWRRNLGFPYWKIPYINMSKTGSPNPKESTTELFDNELTGYGRENARMEKP
jgi:hypothetical protein